MIKSFSQFVAEDANKEIVVAFARFNPPSAAHEKLLEKAAELAKGKPYRIYVSPAEDPKKNPLSLTEKVKFMRKMFPRHARAIMSDETGFGIADVCAKLYEQGFAKVNVVVCENIVEETKSLLEAYNGRPQVRGAFYNFKSGSINVVAGAKANPDDSSSATLIEAARVNDLELFSKNIPEALQEKRELFNAVRTGLGLKETRNFRKHIQLESVSEMREAYVSGQIFNVGDDVVIKESSEVGKIERRGSNYLVVAMHDGRRVRKWLNGVELVEKSIENPVQEVSSQTIISYDTSSSSGIPISKLRTKK